jgi:uncharacterized protein YbaP (TraB family)
MRQSPLLLVLLIALSAGCATTQSSTPAASTSPSRRAFLWEVTRPGAPDRPLYLAGSVHVGQPGQFSLPPSLEAAFARAQALVVEVDSGRLDEGQMQGLVMQLGLYPPWDGLSAHLSDETKALLPAALERVGLAPAAVERMRPWMLSTFLAVFELQKSGYDSKGGVDHMLLERARGKKRILELETAESQLRTLASFPEELQDLMLRDQLKGGELTAVGLAQMATAWEGGNPDALARVVFERAKDPVFRPLYEQLFYARNRRMADKVASLLDAPEVHFVVVGAGHLVGPEGIPALLQQRGLTARQLPRE